MSSASLLAVASLLLLTVYVGCEVTLAVRASEAAPHVLWPLLLASAGLTITAFVLWMPRRSSLAADAHRSGVAYLVLPVLTLGILDKSAFVVFCTAYVVSPILLLWIQVAFEQGIVTAYNPLTSRFALTRGSAYASTRTLAHLATRHLGLPVRISQLIPLLLSGVETAAMVVLKYDGYAFSWSSTGMPVYIALKSTLFVCLPILEDAFRGRIP